MPLFLSNLNAEYEDTREPFCIVIMILKVIFNNMIPSKLIIII